MKKSILICLKYNLKRILYFPWRFEIAIKYKYRCCRFDIEKYKKVLIIAPHPDDEALGAGGILSYLSNNGCIVTICYITRGEHSFHYDPSIIAKKRLHISQDALTLLPNPVKVIRYKIADGSIPGKQAYNYSVFKYKIQQLINQQNFDGVFVSSFDEPHQDHSNIGAMLQEIYNDSGFAFDLFGYFVWSWSAPEIIQRIIAKKNNICCFTLSKSEKNCKNALINAYFNPDKHGVIWSGEIPNDLLYFFRKSGCEFVEIMSQGKK